MIYSQEVEMMCPVAQGANHGPAPIPEEAKWVQAKEIKDISGDGGKSNSFYIKAASKGVVSQILQKNSTEGIDTVSSATCSSKAIIEACQKALEQAKN